MMKRLAFKPGVNVELTPSLNRDGWTISNLIRWRNGVPEALLGWSRAANTVVTGVARALHYWVDLTGISRLAIGTNSNLYVWQSGAITDITPIGFEVGQVSTAGTRTVEIWSLDNFGQNLIGCPSGNPIFQWVPGDTNATRITNAPSVNQGCFVLDQIQIVVAYGCSLDNTAADPMLVRWCDQSDTTDWTASAINQAGSYRIPHGSKIVGGLTVPSMALLWTDAGLWSLQYIGFPLVFAFQPIGSNCGLIAEKAAAVLGESVYWMSEHGFFQMTGGGIAQIPCSVWDVVYKNLDTSNSDKCIAGTNYHYGEVWWFYPSLNGNTGEIDSYVKYNIIEREWDYGPATPGVPNPMSRTAWTDQNQPGDPLSIDLGGLLQEADVGYTADTGGPIASSIRSGFADIADGGQIMTCDMLIPDFLWAGTNPSLNLTLYFRNWPGDTPTTLGPFTITPTTEYVTLRKPTTITIAGTTVTPFVAPRGREVAIQIDGVSGWWRLGNIRLRAAPAGRI